MPTIKPLPVLLFSGTILCLFPAAVFAQTLSADSRQSTDGDAPYQLEPLVVTPTLGNQTLGESLSSVTVIDNEAIRRRQPREFRELLLGQPGVDMVSNGSFGKNTSVYLRGTGSESTVLLIDGIRLRSATAGSAPWAYLPPQMLERVEIVRGPRSSLYGADAVGGVIQAFTHSPTPTPEGWVSLGGGSFDSQETGAGVTGSEGRFRYSFSANHYQTDGTAIVENGDDKGYHNTSGIARVSHQFDNGGEAGLLLMRAQGNTEFEGGETDFTVQTLGLNLDVPISDYWISRVQFAESRDEGETLREEYGQSVFDTRTRNARWENHLFAGEHQFILGTELLVDQVDSTVEYEESSRTNTAIFGQALFDFGVTDFQLSLRGDDNEAYGRHDTGAAALGVALDQSHRVRFSYGTSFRAPTFNDLYYPGFGNPDLEPEEAATFEIGIGGRYERWFWDAVAYQTDVDNLIVTTNIGGVYAPFNVDEARIRGIELSSGLELDNWTIRAAASVSDPRNRETDNRIRRRSAQQARLDVDRELGEFFLGGTVKSQGYRYDDAENEDRLPGFAILDLRAGWRFAENWSTRLTVDNVLDKEYTTARQSADVDYISAGRTAFLSVRYDIR